MGTAISCLQKPHNKKSKKVKPPQHSQYQPPKASHLIIWKRELGITDNSKFISFEYPIDIQHNSFKQINKDIRRTFPDSQFFRSESNRNAFEELLKKFAVYFAKTGYTQGMNFLAGYLLMGNIGSDMAFTMLCKMSTHHNMMCIGLYEDQFPLIRAYCAIFWEMLDDKKPTIAQKIKQLNVPDDLWIFQWFMTFFIYSFPLYLVREFLTQFLTFKGFYLPKIAYGIIIELEKDILECQQEIYFLELCERLKTREFCQSKLNIKTILSNAGSVTQQKVGQYLQKTPLENNFYLQYFRMPENDRKMKSLEIFNQLHEERRQFIKNPTSKVFSRNLDDISILDNLENIGITKLYHSLVNQAINIGSLNDMEDDQQSTKMWVSDVMHIQKNIEQLKQPVKEQKENQIKKQVSIKRVKKIQKKEESIPIEKFNFKKKKINS